MTMITLDDSTAKALADQAAALGLDVQEYLRRHIAGGNGQGSTEKVSPSDVDQWLDEISEGLPSLTSLPHDLSREDIYDKHD